MTITIKSENVNNVNISIEQSKFESLFKVSACPIYEIGVCGYPITETFYQDKRKAVNRYNYLKRQATKGNI